MIFFIIAYTVVGMYATLLAWGLATIDIRKRDISLLGAIRSIAIGIFWLPCLIICLIWVGWEYHTK